ncbi:MAG: hypothetical protein JWM93_602 [Frankiales bacterium]|nr:hypothetical protein [Frankiales bacterium]
MLPDNEPTPASGLDGEDPRDALERQVLPVEPDPTGTVPDGDRIEQAQAVAAVTDSRPGPLPERALDTANEADLVDQQIPVPIDDEDYR